MSINIYDFDTFEIENSGSQFMTTEDIGSNKAAVAVGHALRFSDYFSTYEFGLFDTNSVIEPYVFSCFDNMAGRRLAFEKFLAYDSAKVFIDGRLLAESFEIFVIQKGNKKHEEIYEKKHLFGDNEVEDLACTLKATTHCGAMIASMMVGMFNNFLTNQHYKEEIRDVPFHIIYDMALVNLEILDE